MSKLKKALSLILVGALTAGISISGTMAYLTKDAGKAENVFSVGNIDISLDEEVGVYGEGGEAEKNKDGAEYTDIMPGDYLKKEVTVTNNGKTDAYVAVTVTMNNGNKIAAAIDDYYEKKLGKSDATDEYIYNMYNKIFDGWGMNYYHNNEYGYDARNTITQDDGYNTDWPEYVMKVDYTETMDIYWLYSMGNWFKSDAELVHDYWTDGAQVNGDFSLGYYTKNLEKGNESYTWIYTYYIYLPAGQSTTLFNGLNVPAEFTNEQMAMFEGLEINVEAKAIQADNMGVAAIYADDETYGEAKTAFAVLAGTIDADSLEVNNNPNKPVADTWDGTADISWYNENDTEFVIMTAEQLAGFADLVDAGNTFEGKTVKLGANIDLYAEGEDGEPISFQPIGSYAFETAFSGIFDGQDYTISNMYQNGWALGSGLWDGDDCGLGLFGLVENATIKNLKIDGSDLPSECNLIGFVAGTAYGECVFEDITVTNSYSGNHSYYSGGIVGWASGTHKYINCDVDASNVISSQWGDFNNALGGIIGGAGKNGTYYFEDCDIACVLDAYNDVTSAYDWWAYRNCGMLIGNTGRTTTNNSGTTIADAFNVTCVNCTVTYGDWANYHYCYFGAMNYPWVRVEAGESCHAYGNARYDYATDANGNNVVDENHVHNEGEYHDQLIALDQLFGGSQGGVYGNPVHDGVTVIYNNK